MSGERERVLKAVDALSEEAVAFTREMVRVPTVNPPGENYEDCARLIGERLRRGGFAVEYHAAEGRPEHTGAHPRVNVVGARAGEGPGSVVHLNGHFDVVPAGDGWTVDPFGGEVRDGRVSGDCGRYIFRATPRTLLEGVVESSNGLRFSLHRSTALGCGDLLILPRA